MNRKRHSLSKSIDLHEIAHRTMTGYGFYSTFPRAVTEEVKDIRRDRPLDGRDPSVRDLSGLLWSSIDNHDSQDLDQLEYCERMANNELRVMVAIADVDRWVEKGSAVDRYASHNGTSVYTGVDIFTMIPQELCYDLSSLKDGVDRRAIVVEYVVRKNGSVRQGGVYPAIVHNKAKLIYEEIGDWLEGSAGLPESVAAVNGLEQQIRLQDAAAGRLHNYRMEQGALELETIEPKPVIVDDQIVDLVLQHKNRARYIIENFMIAANMSMVAFLEKSQSPMIQRVVRTPDQWLKIVELASSLGDSLPMEPDQRALAGFLARRRKADLARFPDLSLTIVKLLGHGEYVMVEPGKAKYGHFGLAVRDYTHSTAPNRRYVDIVIQRLIKAALAKQPVPYTKRELIEHAAWCTDRDQASKKVERFMRKVAAAVLLTGREGDIFDSIVTGASEKGVYVRLLNPPVEGRVVRGETGMQVGQKAQVRLLSMDPERGFIDFARVGQGQLPSYSKEESASQSPRAARRKK